MNKFVTILLTCLLVMTGIKVYLLHRDEKQLSGELKKLKENTDIVLELDSILSAREQHLLDSIKVFRKVLDEAKKLQHDENTKLRRRNEALERRFRDLVIPDRPDF
jgi:hypothetical protein